MVQLESKLCQSFAFFKILRIRNPQIHHFLFANHPKLTSFFESCITDSCLQVHDFLKPEHLPAVFKIFRISGFRIPGIRMETVEKLYDVKSTFINIEMDIVSHTFVSG